MPSRDVEKNRLNRDGTYFLSEADALQIYVRISPLIRFHSLVSRPTLTFRRALTPDVNRVVCDKRSLESVNTVSSQKVLLPQSYRYPNLSEGADRVGGQLRGDKECPFSGVTKSGRVWRKVPESDARGV